MGDWSARLFGNKARRGDIASILVLERSVGSESQLTTFLISMYVTIRGRRQ